MNWLEWVGTVLGLINVALIVRRSVWNYPFGIAMVIVYFFVFAEAKLYSDAILQVFFLLIQVYGWWNWTVAIRDTGDLPVGPLRTWQRVAWGAGTVLAGVVWGWGMARWTDAAAPFADAFVAGASVAAQILLARRRIETWVLWILVDIVAIALYVSRDLMATAGLYAVFLVLSVIGLHSWYKAMGRSR